MAAYSNHNITVKDVIKKQRLRSRNIIITIAVFFDGTGNKLDYILYT